jgi:hypothetical protein
LSVTRFYPDNSKDPKIFPASLSARSDRETLAGLARRCLRGFRPFRALPPSVRTGDKGQGRSQRELMTRAYWGFLVHETKFQASIPIMRGIHGIARLCQAGFIPRPPHTPRTLPSHNARAQSRQATEAAGGRSAAHGRNGGRPEKCRTAPGALCRTTPAANWLDAV